jgi:hypothetical protein
LANTAAELLGAAKAWRDVLRTLLTDAIADGNRVTAWMKGSPTRSIYYGVARSLASLSEKVQAIANQGFRSTAKSAALTLVAREVFGITRPGATYATTTILVTNAAGGNYPFAARELIVLNTTRGKQYVNIAPVTIGPLAVDVSVEVIAIEAGSDSAALPDEIDAFVTSVDRLSISQPNPALASDEMSDEDLAAACAARVGFVPTASTVGAGGARGAYESVARSGTDGRGGVLRPDGTRISVTRVRVLDESSGFPQVVVADEDGPIETSDLALVDASVKVYCGLSSSAVNSVGLDYAFTYTAYVPASSSATDDECKAAGQAAIVAYLKRVAIGGVEIPLGTFRIPLNAIERALGNAIADVAGDAVSVTITSPGSDPIILDPKGVPRLSGTPTATILRVSGI